MRQPRPFFVRNGRLKVVRLYDRYLRTTEAIGNFRAGKGKVASR